MEESREFELKEQLEKERRKIKTFEDLVGFLEKVKNECNTGYGEAPRAIAQASLATAWYMASEFGITGFQAGFVMWDFIFGWSYNHNKCGLKIVNYDDMLYPQYDDRFNKTISEDIFKSLQEQAKKNLEERADNVHPAVRAHWESIVAGKIPFGYKLKEE